MMIENAHGEPRKLKQTTDKRTVPHDENKSEEISYDEMIQDIHEYQEAHKDDPNPNRFYVYLIHPENFNSWHTYHFDKVVSELGFAYSEKHRCWYWHNHLNLDARLDIRDDKLIDAARNPIWSIPVDPW